jgi:hypothetical protein
VFVNLDPMRKTSLNPTEPFRTVSDQCINVFIAPVGPTDQSAPIAVQGATVPTLPHAIHLVPKPSFNGLSDWCLPSPKDVPKPKQAALLNVVTDPNDPKFAAHIKHVTFPMPQVAAADPCYPTIALIHVALHAIDFPLRPRTAFAPKQETAQNCSIDDSGLSAKW